MLITDRPTFFLRSQFADHAASDVTQYIHSEATQQKLKLLAFKMLQFHLHKMCVYFNSNILLIL